LYSRADYEPVKINPKYLQTNETTLINESLVKVEQAAREMDSSSSSLLLENNFPNKLSEEAAAVAEMPPASSGDVSSRIKLEPNNVPEEVELQPQTSQINVANVEIKCEPLDFVATTKTTTTTLVANVNIEIVKPSQWVGIRSLEDENNPNKAAAAAAATAAVSQSLNFRLRRNKRDQSDRASLVFNRNLARKILETNLMALTTNNPSAALDRQPLTRLSHQHSSCNHRKYRLETLKDLLSSNNKNVSHEPSPMVRRNLHFPSPN
jgi:hypothetical protein